MKKSCFFWLVLAVFLFVPLALPPVGRAGPPVRGLIGPSRAGQELYNGIVLPGEWPPKTEQLTHEPMPVPYLESPPAVIPIDVGRQLFVDDFLIEHTTLRRTFHQAEYHPKNPVLKPDKSWEMGTQSGGHPAPAALVLGPRLAGSLSDGVWYDQQEKLFKMWYMGGARAARRPD